MPTKICLPHTALCIRRVAKKRADLETLALGLLEFETLTGEETNGILKGPNRDP
jgi:hypothetical protein